MYFFLGGTRRDISRSSSFLRWILRFFSLCLLSPLASPIIHTVCDPEEALGLEDGRIPDGALTAKSFSNEQRHPSQARLYGKNAWTSNDNNFFQYLTIDLGEPKYITKIATQGRDRGNEWVQEYRVLYSGESSIAR